MIAVVAYWEDTEKRNAVSRVHMDLWKDTVKPLGVTNLIMVDVDNLNPVISDLEMTFTTKPTLKGALDVYPKAKRVFLETERSIPEGMKYESLYDFKHPKGDVVYVVGSDIEQGLPLASIIGKNDKLVAIETESRFSLWSPIAAGIVLYDRRYKELRRK